MGVLERERGIFIGFGGERERPKERCWRCGRVSEPDSDRRTLPNLLGNFFFFFGILLFYFYFWFLFFLFLAFN